MLIASTIDPVDFLIKYKIVWSWEENALGIQEELEDKMGEENNQNALYSPMKLLKNNNENYYY